LRNGDKNGTKPTRIADEEVKRVMDEDTKNNVFD